MNTSTIYISPPMLRNRTCMYMTCMVWMTDAPGPRLAKLKVNAEFAAPCSTSVLYPTTGGNMHCFTALTSCAVLDVLGPPYSDRHGRHCTYYLERPLSSFSGEKLLYVLCLFYYYLFISSFYESTTIIYLLLFSMRYLILPLFALIIPPPKKRRQISCITNICSCCSWRFISASR